jgi:hypothetical protein
MLLVHIYMEKDEIEKENIQFDSWRPPFCSNVDRIILL